VEPSGTGRRVPWRCRGDRTGTRAVAEDSFERFYSATYERLLRQLALVTGDRGDAEDVLQEAYGRASSPWRRLPVGQRQVIVLHHLVGLPVNEVATQLRIPAGTVKTPAGPRPGRAGPAAGDQGRGAEQ
jgi:DNA-directed RNA polymerase specialized sigma24 family protein